MKLVQFPSPVELLIFCLLGIFFPVTTIIIVYYYIYSTYIPPFFVRKGNPRQLEEQQEYI